MMATGGLAGTTGGIFPITFVAEGIIGALLEVFTPVSMMSLGMGMILPPHYIVHFGLSGIIRWYTERRFGKEFYDVKGRLIVTGLMASSLIVQIIMTVLTNFLWRFNEPFNLRIQVLYEKKTSIFLEILWLNSTF
jgi:uncharacterized oligopeptide transporter (OPT) family protein